MRLTERLAKAAEMSKVREAERAFDMATTPDEAAKALEVMREARILCREIEQSLRSIRAGV